MLGKYCSLNGKLIKTKKANLPIDHIEFTYGFGVYENLRLRKDTLYHLDTHVERLLESAQMIDLTHEFKSVEIAEWTNELMKKNKQENCNIKMILIGGEKPLLYIMMLPPKYVEKKDYRQGVKVITYNHERFLPQVKSLNMLPSYIIFKKAQKAGAFDALLIDRDGNVVEGTRSNFFVIKSKTLYTSPLEQVLDGITRRTVIECAKQNGYKVIEQNIKLDKIFEYDGAFVTNTSGKIVPIRQIDEQSFEGVCEELAGLRRLYGEYLTKYHK